MRISQTLWSETFRKFVESEKSGGYLLLACTVFSMAAANSPYGQDYLHFWHAEVGGLSLTHWINDALMAIFFLLIGLELERELYIGELSEFKKALLPIVAATGGMLVPALIHLLLNASTPTESGFGIPMATDIAFALAVLAILGTRVPQSVKLFIVAFAVIDDLGAIAIIGVFYTSKLSLAHLTGALAVWVLLLAANRFLSVKALSPYLLGGALMWYFIFRSGIHATIAGVMLAFAIPFSNRSEDRQSPSHILENFLHKPVAFFILPTFALANTCIPVGLNWMRDLLSANSVGIAAGLILGKPLGVIAFCLFAVAGGFSHLPSGLKWRHLIGAAVLGGIGFTMSIFIANLAFPGDMQLINSSKLAVILASLVSGVIGYFWLLLHDKTRYNLND